MGVPSKDTMKRNAQGHWVEIENIEDIDIARDELVMELVKKAGQARDELALLKGELMAEVQAFVELSTDMYGVKLGGKKGNVSLMSFDGRFKVQRQMSDLLQFDERLMAAKELIDECLHSWTDGSSSEVKTLIDYAFQVDKEGNINTGRVLGLRRLKIDDEKWKRAMEAISDSIQVVSTKPYIRIYQRNEDTDKFEPISLDIAAV